jgi:PAS domain S-box-containing protein
VDVEAEREGADRPHRVIVEHMGEGAVTVSGDGVVLYANPHVADFLGIDRDTMVGTHLTSYVAEDQQAALAELMDCRSEGTRRAELRLRGTYGTSVPFQVAVTDLELEGDLVRCLVLTDLTMQKLLEQQVALEAARTERQRVAREVNDTIVQGLVAAEMALDLQQVDYARALVSRTSAHARHWIGELSGGDRLEPGTALRSSPASLEVEAE